MDTLLQLGTDYWPYLIGLFFLGITLINMRSWLRKEDQV